MDRIQIPATSRSPLVDFDFAAGRLLLRGESYPEDAAAFYGPLLQALRACLEEEGGPITFDGGPVLLQLVERQGLMNLFMPLEDAAEGGRAVTIRWLYAEGTTPSRKPARTFRRFLHARFEMVQETAA